MWMIAIITDTFILRALTKMSSLLEMPQMGSIPKGQMQSGSGLTYYPSGMPSLMAFQQQEPKMLRFMPRKSLQIQPQQKAKKPIMRTMYLSWQTKERELLLILSLKKTRQRPRMKMTPPWAISPNMTPKKKGKVTVVKMAGLIYQQRGTPQVSVISWAMTVQQLVLKVVGGLVRASSCISGAGFIIFMRSTSSCFSLEGRYTSATRKCSLSSILLRLSQMSFYFQRQVLQVSREWRWAMPSRYWLNYRSLRSRRCMTYLYQLRLACIYAVFCWPSLNWKSIVVKVYIILCSFFSRTPLLELGQTRMMTLSQKFLRPSNWKEEKDLKKAKPRDTLQTVLDNFNSRAGSMMPTMADMPFSPPMASSPSIILSPKKLVMASQQAILERAFFWLDLSLSRAFFFSTQRSHCSAIQWSQWSMILLFSMPFLAAMPSQLFWRSAMQVGSISLYYQNLMSFSLRASVMVLILTRSQSTLFCWLKKGRLRGLPMSTRWALPIERSSSIDWQQFQRGRNSRKWAIGSDLNVIFPLKIQVVIQFYRDLTSISNALF